MTGLKPAVIGLIGSAAVSMGKTVFFSNGTFVKILSTSGFYISLATFLAMAYLALKKKHPILIICISAVIGIISGYTNLI